MACFSSSLQQKVQEKVGLNPSHNAESGKGKSKMSKNITHGYHLVKGKANHPMEDYVFAEFKQVNGSELGLFAIFDGHLSHVIPEYLKANLFNNILNEPDFWSEPENAIRKAYRLTDTNILEQGIDLGKGGSTAVTAILINCQKLVIVESWTAMQHEASYCRDQQQTTAAIELNKFAWCARMKIDRMKQPVF
ncbi:hypothetical protein ERO13_D05G354601v2 [Gossypium hirsutum]|uniref:PPM-type phosphatase domain-containing protein n=1 Tax=Gossypium barbadense TaxID=3634 RepID=A0A5J5RMX7_GOSBA|nr:hypothetical protein ES319_D05G393100v1 [Gossypium barbadense]KAG4149773.1 hypothetical protein ERO13_D05G354601v2 [Gossypium hirsutum]